MAGASICRVEHGRVPSTPYHFFLSDVSKDQIVNEMDLKGKFLLGFGIVFGITSLGILGYSAFRNWLSGRHGELLPRNKRFDARRDGTYREVEEAESENVSDCQLCVCCLRRRRRSAFVPCGNLVCCSRCAMAIERDTAPLFSDMWTVHSLICEGIRFQIVICIFLVDYSLLFLIRNTSRKYI